MANTTLIVSDYGCVQVMTLEGAPLQVLSLPSRARLGGLCASESRVWATSSDVHAQMALLKREPRRRNLPMV